MDHLPLTLDDAKEYLLRTDDGRGGVLTNALCAVDFIDAAERARAKARRLLRAAAKEIFRPATGTGKES